MSQTSYLYRRPSGIYVVRISVPARLKLQLSRSEIHVSTRCTDLRAAKALAFEVLRAWHLRFEELRRMDMVSLSDAGGVLEGDGLISLGSAASLFGMPASLILRDIVQAGGRVYGDLTGVVGWHVPEPWHVERNYDGKLILNDVPNHGESVVIDQVLELADLHAVPGFYDSDNNLSWPEFLLPGMPHERIFVLNDSPLTDKTIMLQKPDLARYRKQVIGCITPDVIEAERAARRMNKPTQDPIAVVASSTTISGLADYYIRAHQQMKSWKRPHEQGQTIIRTIKLFTELEGDLTLDKITATTLLDFRGQLELLPANMAKARRKYGDISIKDIIMHVQSDGMAVSSPGKVELHVMRVGTVLSWGVKNGFLTKSPLTNIVSGPRRRTKSRLDRLRYNDDDLRQLFSFEWFKTGRGRRSASTGRHHGFEPFHYWMPLLGYYTGARLGELCQLHLADFKVSDNGVNYLDITETMDTTVATRPEERIGPKSLKNKDSEREVPIHAMLIEHGLLEYVAALRQAGFKRLFPELTYSATGDKRYTADVIRKFSGQKKLLDLGADAARKSFHSYRHTFADSLCRCAKFEDVKTLIGHSISKDQLGDRYYKGKRASELKPVLDMLPPLPVEVARFDVHDGLAAVLDCFSRRKTVKTDESSLKLGQ